MAKKSKWVTVYSSGGIEKMSPDDYIVRYTRNRTTLEDGYSMDIIEVRYKNKSVNYYDAFHNGIYTGYFKTLEKAKMALDVL